MIKMMSSPSSERDEAIWRKVRLHQFIAVYPYPKGSQKHKSSGMTSLAVPNYFLLNSQQKTHCRRLRSQPDALPQAPPTLWLNVRVWGQGIVNAPVPTTATAPPHRSVNTLGLFAAATTTTESGKPSECSSTTKPHTPTKLIPGCTRVVDDASGPQRHRAEPATDLTTA